VLDISSSISLGYVHEAHAKHLDRASFWKAIAFRSKYKQSLNLEHLSIIKLPSE